MQEYYTSMSFKLMIPPLITLAKIVLLESLHILPSWTNWQLGKHSLPISVISIVAFPIDSF